jgi:hypothetical protein
MNFYLFIYLNQAPNTTDSNYLYNPLELLMMGIKVPETCWTSNKICNKNSSVASSWHFISTYYRRCTVKTTSNHILFLFLQQCMREGIDLGHLFKRQINSDPCCGPHRAKKNCGVEIQLFTKLIVCNPFQFLFMTDVTWLHSSISSVRNVTATQTGHSEGRI